MAQTLEIRPLRFIASAYALAPLAGLTTLWFALVLPTPHPERAMAMSPDVIVLGGVVCLAVELVVVTPLLIGYRRHRWRWLNGWTGVALGFAVGALASAATATFILSDVGVYISGPHDQVLVANGAWTPAGWRAWPGAFIALAPPFGLGGAVAALVLRLIAVRAVPSPHP
jgi:hypothetical protein